MDKINRPVRNLSLRKSFILYVVVFAMLALVLSIMTISICDKTADKIRSTYPPSGEKYYLTNEQGEQLGDGAYIGNALVPLSKHDERMIALLEVFPTIAVAVYSALCIIAAALLFYRNKLKKPLAELMAASEKISNNDLDFSIEYDSKDELGQLCTSFEIMRTALANNFTEMWRQVEERKQLNAAFAHDLRTPLTVLKGYNEMLQAMGITLLLSAISKKQIVALVASAAIYLFPVLLPVSETNPLFRYIGLLPLYQTQAISLMSVEQMSNGMLYAVWAVPVSLIFLGIGIFVSRRAFAKHQVS